MSATGILCIVFGGLAALVFMGVMLCACRLGGEDDTRAGRQEWQKGERDERR
jgi:hypothetical protein